MSSLVGLTSRYTAKNYHIIIYQSINNFNIFVAYKNSQCQCSHVNSQ